MNGQRSDFELLSGFLRNGEQAAFAQLAQRHLNLVYATAWRKLQDEGAAQEVAQNVFAVLARKAWQFAVDDSLPAWLYKTTLLESRAWLRGELRRRRREQTAAELGTAMRTPDDEPALRALVPLLDEALLSLREKDREVLLLRFYENQPLREVGQSLGVAEEAARKRVGGALGKLARFFQRRGYKTATVATAAAALQHTASSAPAAVADAILSATGRIAPAMVPGLAGPLSRLAGLTKLQTAALCVALAVAPLGWEWQGQRRAREQAGSVEEQLAAARAERSELRVQLETAEEESRRLDAALAGERDSSAQRAKAAEKLAAWKKHLRAVLTADNYRWPEDSPFVRIPKSVVKQVSGPDHSIMPPGVLSQAARELMGLTPQERERVEAALRAHFSAVDQLIADHLYETNALSPFSAQFSIPAGALASKVWAIPALGADAASQITELETALQASLGDERWALAKEQMDMRGTDTLRRVLNVDAAQNPQEMAVWISDHNGKPMVGYGWHENGSAFTSDGAALESFGPAANAASGNDAVKFLDDRGFPNAVTTVMLGWVQQQAAALAGKEAAK
jgi:RNA polymerase sigma factor (sigma-70 family)